MQLWRNTMNNEPRRREGEPPEDTRFLTIDMYEDVFVMPIPEEREPEPEEREPEERRYHDVA
ncbi:MAG: hypothetical protein HXS44_09755 [Theionarchaea archaeon]|nr:hypothetical protein [Theionarchaea archaeon]